MDACRSSDLVTAVSRLAGLSNEVSSRLYPMTKDCAHDTTGEDISTIADELVLLSTTLYRLEEAMLPDPNKYTITFRSDLSEIIQELELVLDEITECCNEIHKADTPSATVPWMFKKGRVARLNKHLEALKTTLVVMRNVLWEGTDSEKDGNLLGSRAFLEAAITQNRNTINELYSMDVLAAGLDRTPSTMSNRPKAEGGTSSGSCVCGQLPCICLSRNDNRSSKEPKGREAVTKTHLNRRFSKRGVRLGVHSSILDLGAHDAPEYLKEKWAAQARSDHQRDRSGSKSKSMNHNTNLPSIAESDPVTQLQTITRHDTHGNAPIPARTATASTLSSTLSSTSDGATRSDSSNSRRRKHSFALMNSAVGQQMRSAVRKLSSMNLRDHARMEEESCNTLEGKGKEKEASERSNIVGSKDGSSKKKRPGFMHTLLNIKSSSPLCTPDFLEETEGSQQSGLR